MNKKTMDVIVIGFALFAMFFGAGNLIFPPFLGLTSGAQWGTGFIGFIIADVGLALMTVLAAAKAGGSMSAIMNMGGKRLGAFFGAAIMICIGPLLAIPRTGATTFEMGIATNIPGFSPILFSVIFFGLTLVLTIKPSKVIDIIGQFLTPALLIALAVLIIKGIITPIGEISPDAMIPNVFSNGISQGYQTMDALGAAAFAAVIITSLVNKGYTGEKEKIKLTLLSSAVAGIGLILVYGGLAYLGATVSTMYPQDVSQAALVVSITEHILGGPGKIILGVIVGLACLTTSIGLTAATADYFTTATNGKLKYEHLVIAVCVFSAVVANFGVNTIIQFSAPILTILYPVTVVLVVMSIFSNVINNDAVYKGSVYVTLVVSILTVAQGFGITVPFIDSLPLASLGFNWIVPAIVGGIAGSFFGKKKQTA
jgi:branched-chain amino acid:cation transporter, LIVCS family